MTTPYGIVLAKDVMVSMRDGIRLATDIYRPARDGEPVEGRMASCRVGSAAGESSRAG